MHCYVRGIQKDILTNLLIGKESSRWLNALLLIFDDCVVTLKCLATFTNSKTEASFLLVWTYFLILDIEISDLQYFSIIANAVVPQFDLTNQHFTTVADI